MLYLLPFAAALANRLRGRGTLGNQPDRLIVAIVLSTPILLAQHWQAAGVFVFLTWLAFTWGWGKWMNCRNWRETLFMSLRGVLITAPIAFLPLLAPYSDLTYVLALSGGAMGLIYRAGRLLASDFRTSRFLGVDPIAISEVMFGFWLGLVMSGVELFALTAVARGYP
jgi:hypothetical protein